MTYEIITVDWNPTQTKIWKFWIAKNCPTAKVYTIPDRRPFRYCWSGAKVDCWLYGFKGRRIIYLDTDTIVTRDMEEVFDMMGDRPLGASTNLKTDRMANKFSHLMPQFKEEMGLLMDLPPNISSGMLVCNNYDPELIYGMWVEAMEHPLFHKYLKGHYTCEEYAISLGYAATFPDKESLWEIPNEIHGNLYYRKKQFGKVERPMVIHYHRPKWAPYHGIEELLNV